MKTLSLIAQKGGTGKTTLAIHLGVQALLDGLRVLLIDADPQASASAWWQRRSAETPVLVQSSGDELGGILDQARSRGFDLAIIDTAPHNSHEAAACARVSDCVYIPTRPAILDLDAIGATTGLVQEIQARAWIILNACPPATRGHEPRIVTEARDALTSYRIPVCAEAVSQRAAFSHALIDGRAVTEFDAQGKAAAEISALWQRIRGDMNP